MMAYSMRSMMIKLTVYLKSGATMSFAMRATASNMEANMILKKKQGRVFSLETDNGSVILDPYEISGVLIEKS